MANRAWKQTKAKVMDCSWKLIGYDDAGSGAELGEYVVSFRYAAAGRSFSGSFNSSQKFEAGDSIGLAYDERNPAVNDRVMTKPVRWMSWIIGALLAVTILWIGHVVSWY